MKYTVLDIAAVVIFIFGCFTILWLITLFVSTLFGRINKFLDDVRAYKNRNKCPKCVSGYLSYKIKTIGTMVPCGDEVYICSNCKNVFSHATTNQPSTTDKH